MRQNPGRFGCRGAMGARMRPDRLRRLVVVLAHALMDGASVLIGVLLPLVASTFTPMNRGYHEPHT
jgi:hypothetical protein